MTEAEIYDMALSAMDADRMARSLKAQAQQLQAEAKALGETVTAKREAIAAAMDEGGFQEVSGRSAVITYRKAGAPAVHITDESAIPEAFMVTPEPTPKPDKNAIKKALKDGADVPGAVLANGAPSVSIKELGNNG